MAELKERVEGAVSTRAGALDGIRGIAILLVVLSHGWALWSLDRVDDTPVLGALLTSGNFAVTVFFVVGGFLGMTGMLRDVERDGRPTPRAMLGRVVRRAVRTGAHSYTLLVFVMFVAVLDVSETYPEQVTRTTVWRVVTFTFNWLMIDQPLNARPDLGHLWYICVDLQVFVLLVVLVRLLGHRRVALLATLLGLVVLVTWWRSYSLDHESVFDTGLRTTVRMDGLLWGAALATALPYLARAASYARVLAWASSAVLLALLATVGNSNDYYGGAGVLLNLGVVGFVLASTYAVRTTPLRAMGWRPLRVLGRMSLALYIWHYPIFWAVARWDAYNGWGWAWGPKAALAFGLTALFAYGAQRVVEDPLQRRLARSRPTTSSGAGGGAAPDRG